MVGRDRPDQVHGGRLPVQMDCDDRASPRSDRSFETAGIEVVGSGIGVDRHRDCAHLANGEPGRDEGIGRHDHLVTGCDLLRAKRETEGVEAAAYANAVSGADIACEGLLERLQLGPHEVPPASHHALDRGVELLAQFLVRGNKIEKGNGRAG